MNFWVVSFDFVQIPANAKNADANNANANNAPSWFVGGARAQSMLLAALIDNWKEIIFFLFKSQSFKYKANLSIQNNPALVI